MNRDEAVKAVISVFDEDVRWLDEEGAGRVLDAIGFDQMQERIKGLEDIETECLEARALADELVRCLVEVGKTMRQDPWDAMTRAMAAYEARDWK